MAGQACLKLKDRPAAIYWKQNKFVYQLKYRFGMAIFIRNTSNKYTLNLTQSFQFFEILRFLVEYKHWLKGSTSLRMGQSQTYDNIIIVTFSNVQNEEVFDLILNQQKKNKSHATLLSSKISRIRRIHRDP